MMDGWWSRFWGQAWGQDTLRAGEGIESTLNHSWPFAPWITLLLALLCGGLVIGVYYRETGSKRLKTVLAMLRLASVGLVILMMYGWMIGRHRTDLPDLVIAMDISLSMDLQDHYEDAELQDRLMRRLQSAQLQESHRLNLARMLLLEGDARRWRRLRDRYNIKLYFIGASARIQSTDKAEQVEQIRSVQPSDTSSRLGACLQDILEAQRGRPTAAVVVMSDGVTTQGPSLGKVAPYARRKAVPLFLLGLGDDQPPRDLRLDDLLADDVVFRGDVAHFDFKLSAVGYANRQVRVQLLRADGDLVLEQKHVTLGSDTEPQSVRLSHQVEESGDFEFRVEVETLAGEVDPENNHQVRLVSVRDETIRVLYVQEYPSFEFRFLKALLGRTIDQETGHKRPFALTTVLQEADLAYSELDQNAQRVFPVSRDELFRYDVVLFGDVNPSFLSQSVLDNLTAFVKQRGGGIVFLSGPRHTPVAYRDSPLAELLPINLETVRLPNPDALLVEPISLQPTQLGMLSPLMQLANTPQATLQLWRSLPGVRWMVTAPDVRLGTRVLAEHPSRTGNDGQGLPLICLQFVGAGKTVFLATDESYLWARHQETDTYYERFWLQTVRYLARGKLLSKDGGVEMPLDRETYYRGEPVRLRVRFLDERLAPPEDDGVTAIVEHSEGKRRQVRLYRDAGRRGVFQGTLSNLPDGRYRAWLAEPTLPGRPPSRQFLVTAPPGEKARPQMDLADLRLAAKTSQGGFYRLGQAERLFRDLPEGRQVRIEALPSRPVWNHWILVTALVLLIATEWSLRKLGGML